MHDVPPPASQSAISPSGGEDKKHLPGEVLKRALDLVITLPLLTAAAPLMLIAGLAIRLTSPGPALFIQLRMGRHRRLFPCYKLRTMQLGTPDRATHLSDPHNITAVGRLLRRSKLDELPQLWNVLRGDMSLVGPRPCLPNQYELIELRNSLGVYSARPGITGLAQTSGCDMSRPERCAQLDAEYIDRHSLRLDLQLMIKTLTF